MINKTINNIEIDEIDNIDHIIVDIVDDQIINDLINHEIDVDEFVDEFVENSYDIISYYYYEINDNIITIFIYRYIE